MVRESVAVPFSTIDGPAWHAAVPSVSAVVLDPPFLCITDGGDVSARRFVAAEIQLKAAQAGVAINSVYAARTRPDCRPPGMGTGALYVGLRPGAARPDLPCAAGPIMVVCHATLPLPMLALLAATIALPGSADGS